jgi:hypothetical protein
MLRGWLWTKGFEGAHTPSTRPCRKGRPFHEAQAARLGEAIRRSEARVIEWRASPARQPVVRVELLIAGGLPAGRCRVAGDRNLLRRRAAVHATRWQNYRRAALSLCRSPLWSQRRSRRVLLRTTDGDTATDANSGVGIIPTFPKAGRVVEMQPGLHIDLGFDRSDDRNSGQRRSDCRHGESCLHHGLAPAN